MDTVCFILPVVCVDVSAFEPDMALSSSVSACQFEVKGGRQMNNGCKLQNKKLQRIPTDTKSIRKT